ncbi:unannotated protein [freshwater metagenome]|uniref:Unannotated protein n=1 Tax=freshwater metagenome TaxID=449393 RepID=A0A6J7JV32_9ZZZZ|nr:transcriptional regulator [Actinomycetota bacterium]
MITLDRELTAGAYGRAPFAVEHGVDRDPRLTLESLVGLAAEHPADLIEHNLGTVPVTLPGGAAPSLALDPEAVLREIADNGSWMVLKNVERDPAYAALLDDLLDRVGAVLPGTEGTGLHREAFVFVSAPGSVTPVHVDPENNLLLQVRGTKAMHVGSFADADVRARELERFYGGAHRNLEQRPVDESTFALEPGDGVYLPPDVPHWVQNGPEVSVSLSITWRTRRSGRDGAVLAMNHRLRRRGVRPTPPGVSRVRDGAKVTAHRVLALPDRLRRGA